MKKIVILSMSMWVIFLATSCSNETENVQPKELDPFENLEPYISPQMQEVLNMLDTATVPVPLSVLIPGIDEYLTKASDPATSFSQTRAVGDVVTVVGHSTYSVPLAKTQISITLEQATAFNERGIDGGYNTGPFYITFYIATQNVVNPGGLPIPIITNQDIIGFNPDKPADWGYTVTEVVKNVYYQLTTYLYAIHGENEYGPINQIYGWIPFNSRFRDIYLNSSSGAWDLVILRGLEWNYVVGPNSYILNPAEYLPGLIYIYRIIIKLNMPKYLLPICLLSFCFLNGCTKDKASMDAYYYVLKDGRDTKQYLRPNETLFLALGEVIDIYFDTDLHGVSVHGPGDEIMEVTREQTDADNPRTFYRCLPKKAATEKLVITDADVNHMIIVPLEIRPTEIEFVVNDHFISGMADDPEIDLQIREEIENRFFLTGNGFLMFNSLTHGEAEMTWTSQSDPSKGELRVNDGGYIWIFLEELDFPVHYYETGGIWANFSYDLTDYFQQKYPAINVQGIIVSCTVQITGKRPLAPQSM